jgi:hypothetical protein
MRARLLGCVAVFFCGLLLLTAPLSAHHASRAVYGNNTVTLMGTVTHYEWSNPHIIVSVQVKGKNGNIEEWHAEVLPPTQATAAGWTKESIKIGDQVTLVGHPGKNAQRILLLEELVTPDGRTLGRK